MVAPSVRSGTNSASPGFQHRLTSSGGNASVRVPAEVRGHFQHLRESLHSGKSDEITRTKKDLATSLSSSLRGQGVPERDIQAVLSSIGQLKAHGNKAFLPPLDPERAPIQNPSSNPGIGTYQRTIAPAQPRGHLMDTQT